MDYYLEYVCHVIPAAPTTVLCACVQSPCDNAKDSAGGCFGGWARISAAVKAAKEAYPATLVLDGGDEFMGTAYDTFYKGQEDPALQNSIGVQAMVWGNNHMNE